MTETAQISVDSIKEMLSEEGFEVVEGNEANVFQIRDLDTGLSMTCVLEENILFNTLPCFSIAKDSITHEMMQSMLSFDNGISTSAFQLYDSPQGQTRVTLTNFCKLFDLGAEDRDDILSCVDFLLVDVVAARTLLAEYL